MVGALFPSVGGSIGKLDVPEGVANLLGRCRLRDLVGWMRSEIGAIYGPLVVAVTAITAAAASTAGEEEDGILGVVLAHPIQRSRLVLEKAAAVAVGVLVRAAGHLDGPAHRGRGSRRRHRRRQDGRAGGAPGLLGAGLRRGRAGLAAATGRRVVAAGGAGAVAVLGYLVNGFAPLVDSLDWLKYLSLFHYYEGHDPLTGGIDVGDLLVLAAVTGAHRGRGGRHSPARSARLRSQGRSVVVEADPRLRSESMNSSTDDSAVWYWRDGHARESGGRAAAGGWPRGAGA